MHHWRNLGELLSAFLAGTKPNAKKSIQFILTVVCLLLPLKQAIYVLRGGPIPLSEVKIQLLLYLNSTDIERPVFHLVKHSSPQPIRSRRQVVRSSSCMYWLVEDRKASLSGLSKSNKFTYFNECYQWEKWDMGELLSVTSLPQLQI